MVNRMMKSRMKRMAVVALQSTLKSLPPVRELVALFLCRAEAVAEVVRETQKSVKRAHCLPLTPRQDPKSVVKVSRLPPSDLLAIAIGIKEGQSCHKGT